MDLYSEFDYLCNEPYEIPNIGTIKNVTLRDIRRLTYRIFITYVNICAMSQKEYIEAFGLKEAYEQLNEDEKSKNNLYRLLLYGQTTLLYGIIDFFITDKIELDGENETFNIYKETVDENGNITKLQVGKIDADSFDTFRNEVLKSLGLKQVEVKKPKYKNERARLLAEKIEKAKSQMQKSSKQDENMSLDNMIKKYCTHNKVGINILNVWDMTFYQFNTMFAEYNVGRQMDFNDMMAANSFNFKDSKDYNPSLWVEKINNNK